MKLSDFWLSRSTSRDALVQWSEKVHRAPHEPAVNINIRMALDGVLQSSTELKKKNMKTRQDARRRNDFLVFFASSRLRVKLFLLGFVNHQIRNAGAMEG
jgi:hypothetical protein